MQLRSDRLTIDVAPPGTLYQGSRFDWAGFITQVTLDGTQTFCAPESRDGSGTGGIGLCNEFGILATPGYDETSPGQPFTKLGVGLLTRPDVSPYSFSRRYEVQPFHATSKQLSSAASEFHTHPEPCNGYAVELIKTISVESNTLLITYRLRNTGSKTIDTDEYVHNFLAPAGVGPLAGTLLRFSFAFSLDRPLSMTQQRHDTIDWTGKPTRPFYTTISNVSEHADAPMWWKLVHPSSGLSVREETSVPWCRAAIYGTPDTLCPEAFIRVIATPGQTIEWSRRFTFCRLDEIA
jgi:hypothetical protein